MKEPRELNELVETIHEFYRKLANGHTGNDFNCMCEEFCPNKTKEKVKIHLHAHLASLNRGEAKPTDLEPLSEEVVYKLLSSFHYVDFSYDDGSMKEKMQDGIDNPRDLAKAICSKFGAKQVRENV